MRVGIVGAGAMGQVHLRSWSAQGAQVCLHDRNLERAREIAAPYGGAVHATLEGLLGDADVVDVCLPTFLHRQLVEQAARAGCHVVCEKPLALSVEDGEAMVKACEDAGVRLFVAMVVRFFPQYRQAWQTVQRGELGPLNVVRLRRVSYPPHGGASWYADEARSGGMLLDLMLHDIDYALWLAGDAQRVYARLNQTGARQYAQVVLTHATGAASLIEGGWAYPDGLFRTALDISGEHGLIEWSSDAPAPVRRYQAARGRAVSDVALPDHAPGQDPYTTQLQHFKTALEHGLPFDVTPQEVLRSLRAALAARESSRTGRAVSLGDSA
ncbi:Gfo/Idh/MocA family protein [Deinococcus peraridilitoris]|uniref:Putative dehydrogenase n=1 Tax=Deinococcus peraridilitoris (strain DSM 19664 / LMG 22246 / CIP 109416 / KR-200) TaxID=937777 RepID=L0A2E5_DEIPD|nr:Gfo/Idh/MocA family oxidoreductase [Deinococcus peraridilitoris]AFZ68021.1 putative dehydrogenase [Deinococcus peraridilitoris DSM 19664]